MTKQPTAMQPLDIDVPQPGHMVALADDLYWFRFSLPFRLNHINLYGSGHTDAILSEDEDAVNFFLNNVDSVIVMHNTSTQFADGGEFGFGGEVGISTNKLPPRGPVGLGQLVSYKYEISSNGKIRD